MIGGAARSLTLLMAGALVLGGCAQGAASPAASGVVSGVRSGTRPGPGQGEQPCRSTPP